MKSPIAGKRIGLLSSWVSRRNGGVFEAVVAQAEMLGTLGAEPVVLGLREEDSGADTWRLDGVETHLVDQSGPGFLGYAQYLAKSHASARHAPETAGWQHFSLSRQFPVRQP